MSIDVECRTCGSKLRVKDSLAGERVRCPSCKMGIAIPHLPDPEEDQLEEIQSAPAPVRSPRQRRPPTPKSQVDDLEFVDDDEEVLPALPRARIKKKKVDKPQVEVKPPKRIVVHRDLLVWVFFLALLPLFVSAFLPETPLGQRIEKSIGNDADLRSDLEQYGPEEFMLMHDTFTLSDAHLARKSDLHWLHAVVATLAFLTLLHFMRLKTKVSAGHLLLAGLFTGTVGIAMLLVFQVIAEVSLHIRFVGTGIGALILVLIKFIGFSYRSAMDPNSGFLWSFVGFTCGVGFCEELCKAVPVFVYLRNSRKSDWRGTTLLGFASGVGFGISEGIMYSGSFYNGIEPITAYIVRFASCVALHAVLSGGVALLMFGNQEYLDGDADWIPFLFGGLQYILIAMILHGLYDTLLKQRLNGVALLVALASFGWMAWLSRYYWNYEPDEE